MFTAEQIAGYPIALRLGSHVGVVGMFLAVPITLTELQSRGR